MVAFGRNIATGKELKSFGGGIWKRYCTRRGTQVFRWRHLEAILPPTRNGGQAPKAFGALWPSFAPDYEVPLAQVNPLASSLWRRSMALLEQVGRPFGAGVTFGDGPAPPQATESCFAVQVIALFPHLRQSGHIPAPRKTFTCANWRGHLRQKHGLADRSMEQVVRCRTGNTCAGKHLICSCIWENGEERGRRCACERWCAGYVRLSAATPGRKWS